MEVDNFKLKSYLLGRGHQASPHTGPPALKPREELPKQNTK